MTKFVSVVTAAADVGPQDPATTTPDRAPNSARRTSSVDVTRPGGPAGPIRIDGRARDALTLDARDQPICNEVRVRATLDPFREVQELTAEPAEPALAGLIGRRVTTGFRAAAAGLVPRHRHAATLLYLLLDDLPVATLVSGYAMQRAGEISDAPRSVYEPNVDLCSGWAAEATIMRIIDDRGTPPMTLGPLAPSLARADDPLAWHDLADAAPRTVRRRRRIDVEFGNGPIVDGLIVDAMFRDSHFDDDAVESVIHEYSIQVTIDTETLVIRKAVATPRVLPYVECPAAAASASRLVGFHLDDVRDRVRAEFVGTSTCTHLNDLFRSLEDVSGLLSSQGIVDAQCSITGRAGTAGTGR